MFDFDQLGWLVSVVVAVPARVYPHSVPAAFHRLAMRNRFMRACTLIILRATGSDLHYDTTYLDVIFVAH